eukprot:335694-Hanusia_phi.AAC.13
MDVLSGCKGNTLFFFPAALNPEPRARQAVRAAGGAHQQGQEHEHRLCDERVRDHGGAQPRVRERAPPAALQRHAAGPLQARPQGAALRHPHHPRDQARHVHDAQHGPAGAAPSHLRLLREPRPQGHAEEAARADGDLLLPVQERGKRLPEGGHGAFWEDRRDERRCLHLPSARGLLQQQPGVLPVSRPMVNNKQYLNRVHPPLPIMEFGFPSSIIEPKQFLWNSSNRAVQKHLNDILYFSFLLPDDPNKCPEFAQFRKRVLQSIEDQILSSYFTTAAQWGDNLVGVNHLSAYRHVRDHIGTEANPIEVNLKIYLRENGSIDVRISGYRCAVPGMRYREILNAVPAAHKKFVFKPFEIRDVHYKLNVTYLLDPCRNY